LSPDRIQVATPEPDAQESVFTAVVAAGPGVIEIPEICAGEKVIAHSRSEGAVPEIVTVTPRVAVPPEFSTAEETLRLLACARDPYPRSKNSPMHDEPKLQVRICPFRSDDV
jgi:hypothetical protein